MVFRNETSTARNGNVWSLGNSGSRVGLAAKRAFDVIVALLGLTLFSPLLLLSSIAIAIESRGPILTREPLYGRDNRIVRAFAFRLKANAQLTRTGHALQETGIAELPRLLNVLQGEMSIVGPPLSAAVSELEPIAKLKCIKPGLFGNATQSAHDALRYIDNWSPFLDIRIILISLASSLSKKS